MQSHLEARRGLVVAVIQDIFNSREIAIGIWLIIAIIGLSFMKPMRDAMKTIIPILLSKKFVVFYIVFLLQNLQRLVNLLLLLPLPLKRNPTH